MHLEVNSNAPERGIEFWSAFSNIREMKFSYDISIFISFLYLVTSRQPPVTLPLNLPSEVGVRSYYNNLVKFKRTLHQKLKLLVPLPKFAKARFREDRSCSNLVISKIFQALLLLFRRGCIGVKSRAHLTKAQ